jgi:4-phospho-D-threonate 3-dehydrogenase / 4-phospho-D-erythronate 3-dehydrogenase
MDRLPVVAITLGDPGGIGPEVVVKALAEPEVRSRAGYLVLGPQRALAEAAQRAGIAVYWRAAATAAPEAGEVLLLDYPADDAALVRGPSAAGGKLSFRMVEDVIRMATSADHPGVHAIVTGPISKQAWQMAGQGKYAGHTELLAARTGTKRFGMMFVTPRLRVILATAHIPLAAVAGVLTVERVLTAIELGDEACRRLGVAPARIAVCGVNPHAGEGGLLGSEDAEVIEPAIRAAQESGMDARGPFPADTIFNSAVRGDFDLVVAMYHDQGLIPVKLLDRDRAVNLTVGLPIIRTSPDHGTAFDIAGENRADPGSMRAALELAVAMSRRG